MLESSERTELEMSRKAFLAGAGSLLGVLLPGASAFANVTGELAEPSEGAEAERLWQEAVERAEEAGEYISDFIPVNGPSLIPNTKVKSAQKTVTIKLVPTVVTASASIETNGTLVSKVNSAWISASAATVSNQGYRYTKADSGRTVCITYWCSITPAHKVPATCRFYAEFTSNGSGWMSGGPVS